MFRQTVKPVIEFRVSEPDHLIQQNGGAVITQDGGFISLNDGITASTLPSVNLNNENNSGMIGVYY